MKIVKIEDLHCDAGWRVNSFLKITADEGIVGWSEYMEGYGAQGLTGIIRKMAERLKPPVFEEGFAKITVVRVKSGS